MRRGELKAKILAELSSGPKNPRALRDAVGGTKMTFARALLDLQDSGQIRRAGGKARAESARYELVSE
jgi:DNA-binding HxlR family transcriptional regulator